MGGPLAFLAGIFLIGGAKLWDSTARTLNTLNPPGTQYVPSRGAPVKTTTPGHKYLPKEVQQAISDVIPEYGTMHDYGDFAFGFKMYKIVKDIYDNYVVFDEEDLSEHNYDHAYRNQNISPSAILHAIMTRYYIETYLEYEYDPAVRDYHDWPMDEIEELYQKYTSPEFMVPEFLECLSMPKEELYQNPFACERYIKYTKPYSIISDYIHGRKRTEQNFDYSDIDMLKYPRLPIDVYNRAVRCYRCGEDELTHGQWMKKYRDGDDVPSEIERELILHLIEKPWYNCFEMNNYNIKNRNSDCWQLWLSCLKDSNPVDSRKNYIMRMIDEEDKQWLEKL